MIDRSGFRDPLAYGEAVRQLQESGQWRDRPMEVTIETYALCNAACTFCPYPDLDRQGVKMPDGLFRKIVDDLVSGGPPLPPIMSLSRVNEPFLDTRYFEFCDYIAVRLPDTRLRHFTNVTPLGATMLDRLLGLENTASVKISFNDHRPVEYERTMSLDFDRAYRNARGFHDRAERGEVPFPVRMGRVGDGTVADADFVEWVRREFPLFQPVITPRFDWIGRVDVEPVGSIPAVGCAQWFQLNFLADGRCAFCCIDSDGHHGTGNAADSHVLDIYNSPERRRLRERSQARKDIDICAGCNALT